MNRGQSDFARFYEEHVWRVYGFLAYRVRDHALAEDLTQATFERALRAWSRFDRRRATEETWLLTIARNLLIDDYRQNRPVPVEIIDERVVPAVPGPEQRFAGSAELLEALAHLSERDLEVLALRFGGDLDGPAIASMVGLSVANVQQIQSRSLRKLRTLLAGDLEPSAAPTAHRRP
ncbi:MAG TPA: sigma-70 family RNA polymerase sigma factor [Solirubrobacteraceae bacterium]|jgi:RNA polymerase sigma-70 factor (ECF subfamily)